MLNVKLLCEILFKFYQCRILFFQIKFISNFSILNVKLMFIILNFFFYKINIFNVLTCECRFYIHSYQILFAKVYQLLIL